MEYPSVTEVINMFVDFSMVSTMNFNLSISRGNVVHKYCLAIAKGLTVPELNGEASGYIESFQKWMEYVKPEIVAIEPEVKNDKFGYIGHPDLIYKRGKDIVLLDIKTGQSPCWAWTIQLAAYYYCDLPSGPVDAVEILSPHPQGDLARVLVYPKSVINKAYSIFINMLNVYRYKNSKEWMPK